MIYKIKMSKNDFFKVNNKILANNLEIVDDDIFFEVESGSFNILKKTNYEFKIVESITSKTKRLIKDYGLIFFGFLFLFSILYLNSYRVSEIVFNRDTPINDEIEKSLKDSFKTLFCFEFTDIDYYDYSKELCNNYFEYPYISVEHKNNKVYVYIAEINEVTEIEKINNGSLISSKTGIIDNYYIYNGINNVYRNKFVKEGEVLIEGDFAKGLVMGTTYEKVNITIPKEETIYEFTNKTSEYISICFGNYSFNIGKEEEFSLYDQQKYDKFNIFDFFIIKKIVENEKSAIIKAYTLNEGLEIAKSKIENGFYENSTNDLEKIISITNITALENDDSYEYCFIVKSYESFGTYKE